MDTRNFLTRPGGWAPGGAIAAGLAVEGAKRAYQAAMGHSSAYERSAKRFRAANNQRTGGYVGFTTGTNRGGRSCTPAGGVVELKFLDSTTAGTQTPAAPNVWERISLSGNNTIHKLAQGTGENQRVGRKVRIKKILATVTVTMPKIAAAAAATAKLSAVDEGRLCLVMDRQSNGTLAPALDIFEKNSFQSYRNLANQERFVVLWDKTIMCNNENFQEFYDTGTAALGGAAPEYAVKTWKINKGTDYVVEFTGATGASGEVTSNSIFWMFISKHGKFQVNLETRIRYCD